VGLQDLTADNPHGPPIQREKGQEMQGDQHHHRSAWPLDPAPAL
jgi:hypothetical protein